MSVDRSESSSQEAEKISLNSSFSGPTSLPASGSEGETRLSPRLETLQRCEPGDGASLQSQERGEVEGSSAQNSPPTSVIAGVGEGWEGEWGRGGSWEQKEEGRAVARRKWGLPSPVTCPGTGEEGVEEDKSVPYEVLLEDLSQAKRQLLELHSLVSFTVLKTCILIG